MAAPATSRAKFAPIGVHGSQAVDVLKTVEVPDGASGLILQARTQNIRITFDGSNPTASVGFTLLTTEGPSYWPLQNDTVVKAISETSGGVLQYQAVKEI